MLSNIIDITEKQTKTLESYKKLILAPFNRSMVKNIVMRDSYNAGLPKLIQSLVQNLTEQEQEQQQQDDKKRKLYTYKDYDIKLNRSDLSCFVLAMKHVISLESPKIIELSKYLSGIVSICIKLSLPVSLSLPSGAEILESYEVEKNQL